jgi:alkylhydroperoxidase family enzyme
MAHIDLPEGLPGIRGPMAFRPETAKHLNELAEVLLRSENSLSRGDRELIATYVSSLNDCFFCQHAHGGIAQHYLQCDMNFIDGVKRDYEAAPISAKLKA